MDKQRIILELGTFKLDKFEKKPFTFFMCKMTEDELLEIQECKKEKTMEVVKEKYPFIDFDNVFLLGDGHLDRAYYKIVSIMDRFVTNKAEKPETHFRDYQKSLEHHKELCHLINICPDATMSWYSALRKIGYLVYARNSELGRIHKKRNDKIVCNIIIWKQLV